jgi:hypothetical protein
MPVTCPDLLRVHSILDKSAVSAFRKWRFKPGTVLKVRTPVEFSLQGTSDQIHGYKIRLRKDKRGVDLISDALPFGRLWLRTSPGCNRLRNVSQSLR